MTPRARTEAPVAPRFALGWAAFTYVLATLSLAYPILAGRFLASPNSDQYLAGYAFREFGAATLKAAGHIPLWNPYLMGGVPYVAGMAGDIFYPPSLLLRAIVPVDVAMSLAFALHLFFAGKGGDGARCIDLNHFLGHDRSNVVGDGGRRNCQRDGLAPTLLRRQWLLYAEPKNI